MRAQVAKVVVMHTINDQPCHSENADQCTDEADTCRTGGIFAHVEHRGNITAGCKEHINGGCQAVVPRAVSRDLILNTDLLAAVDRHAERVSLTA